MKAEELIDETDRLLGYGCDKRCSECNGCPVKDVFNEIKEIIEKQIPKEPRFYNANYYCPECDDLVGCKDTIMRWEHNYCVHCGQAIKWE